MNNRGPKSEPWDTPHVILLESELEPFNDTNCFLPVRVTSVPLQGLSPYP